MLSEGYTDTPTPVELGSFNVRQSGSDMLLSWQTASAINIAGYEIERSVGNLAGVPDSQTIATFVTDDSLRSHSNFGASYAFYDAVNDSGPIRYDLYEVTNDGIAQWLGSQTATLTAPNSGNSTVEISYSNGSLTVTSNSLLNLTIAVSDELGRTRFSSAVSSPTGNFSAPLPLPPGFYFADCRWNGGQIMGKLLVVPW